MKRQYMRTDNISDLKHEIIVITSHTMTKLLDLHVEFEVWCVVLLIFKWQWQTTQLEGHNDKLEIFDARRFIKYSYLL